MRIKEVWRRWFRKEEPLLKITISHEMTTVPDELLAQHTKELTNSTHWPYFIEKLRRQREFHLAELVYSTDPMTHERIKGKVKSLDWFLMLDKNFNQDA